MYRTTTTTTTCHPASVQQQLKTIQEVGAATTKTRGHRVGGSTQRRRSLSTSGAAIIAHRTIHRNQPWTAPSVQALTQRLGNNNNNNNNTARPLIVEGPGGVVISAVGSQRDHSVANAALMTAQTRRVRHGISMTTHRAGENVVSRGGGQSFGAVYEYVDSFGKPKVVSSTSSTPEGAFVSDTKNHQSVRNLMSYQGGQQEVVWAGVGTFPIGPEEMQNITESIVEQRSMKFLCAKLRGPKPYSRHGF